MLTSPRASSGVEAAPAGRTSRDRATARVSIRLMIRFIVKNSSFNKKAGGLPPPAGLFGTLLGHVPLILYSV